MFGLLVGLAVLLKSLAGFIPALVAFVHGAIFRRPTRPPWALAALVAGVSAAAVAGPWFYLVGRRAPDFWPTFWSENFGRMGHPMQGHSGNPFYYLGFILLGFFPWVVFLPAAFLRGLGAGETKHLWRSLGVVWFAVVLVFFTLLKTKLPGYIVPLFPGDGAAGGPGTGPAVWRSRGVRPGSVAAWRPGCWAAGGRWTARGGA